jgi:hypothetical protein
VFLSFSSLFWMLGQFIQTEPRVRLFVRQFDFLLPGYLGQSGNGEKNYKKPAAVDFSSRRCCCATFTSAYSAAAAHIQSVNLTGAVYAKVYGALTIMDRSTR